MKYSLMALAMVLMLPACGSSDEGEEEVEVPLVDCSSVTAIPKYSELTVFAEVCTNCHTSQKTGMDRNGAPATINFDTYEAAKANASKAMEELFEGANGAMPPPTSTVRHATTEERDAANAWAQCGTPE